MTDTLAAIYAAVPDANCKGLCQRACGPVLMSQAEARIIMAKHGSAPDFHRETLTCTNLVGGKCSIYADRPLICRLYGTTRGLMCQHGCGPSDGFLPNRKASALVHRAEKLTP